MLTKIYNQQGIISYDKTVVEQIITENLKPYKGSVWVANYKGPQSDLAIALESYDSLAEKKITMDEHGVYIKLYLMVKIGTSISQVCSDLVLNIGDDIKNVLQLPLNNVEIIVTAVVSKRASKREICYDYKSLIK